MKKLLALLLILGLVSCRRTDAPYVLLVSFDGFRHDYVEKYDAPNFKALIREGSAAEALRTACSDGSMPS